MKNDKKIPAAYIIPGIIHNKKITKQSIIKAVSLATGLTENQIFSRSRQREITSARQIFFYFVRNTLGTTYQEIGNTYNYDHATIIYSIKTVENLLSYDKEYKQLLKRIEFSFKQVIEDEDLQEIESANK